MADSPSERLLRRILEAERAILGLILIDEETTGIALDLVRPEHFFGAGYGRIFSTMMELHHKGTKIDIVTLTEALDRGGDLEKVGGWAGVSSLPRESQSADGAILMSISEF